MSLRPTVLLLALCIALAACGGAAASPATSGTVDPSASAAPTSGPSVEPETATPATAGVPACDLLTDDEIAAVAGNPVKGTDQVDAPNTGGALSECTWTTEDGGTFIEGEISLGLDPAPTYDELVATVGSALDPETSLGMPASFGPGNALFVQGPKYMYTLQVLVANVDGKAAALSLAAVLLGR